MMFMLTLNAPCSKNDDPCLLHNHETNKELCVVWLYVIMIKLAHIMDLCRRGLYCQDASSIK